MNSLDYIKKHEPWLLDIARDPAALPLVMQDEARRVAETLGVIGEPDPSTGLTTYPEWIWFTTYP